MVVGMAEAGQRRDEPLHEEGRRTFHQDTMAEPGLGGDHPLQMGRLLSMDRTSPETAGRFLECVAVCWVIWHVWQLAGAPEGPTFCFLDTDLSQKGPTSPSKGPDVSLFSS
jgi:hypothetical protein